jgi:hypothetical protein
MSFLTCLLFLGTDVNHLKKQLQISPKYNRIWIKQKNTQVRETFLLKGCFKGGVYLPLIITNPVPESLGPVSNLGFLVSLKLLDGDSNKIFVSSNREKNPFCQINKKAGAVARRRVSTLINKCVGFLFIFVSWQCHLDNGNIIRQIWIFLDIFIFLYKIIPFKTLYFILLSNFFFKNVLFYLS